MKAGLGLAALFVMFLGLVAAQRDSPNESMEKRMMVDRSRQNLLVLALEKDFRGNERIKACRMYTEKREIEEILSSTSNEAIQQSTNEEIQDTIDDCSELAESNRRRQGQPKDEDKRTEVTTSRPTSEDGNETTEGYSGIAVILPGTKWCGAGQSAKEIQDLGYYEDTDQCCRAHDLCNDTLAPGETKNNLTNESSFTKLNCRCDDEFYECLETINSVVSNALGNLYYNILRRGCYTYDHPDGACKTYRSFLKVTCKEYGKDASAPKTWHWVSAKRYKTLPIPGPLTITLDF